MSKSELHDWECEIEELSGNNADKMLGIARDIYKTAFVRGRNSMTWEQTRWIPCSERMPKEEKKTYWICTNNGYQCECRWTNVNPFWTYLTTDWHWHIADVPQYNKVVAWMPLPEPYKAEMESGVCKGCHYNDGEVHAECVVCDKAEMER